MTANLSLASRRADQKVLLMLSFALAMIQWPTVEAAAQRVSAEPERMTL